MADIEFRMPIISLVIHKPAELSETFGVAVIWQNTRSGDRLGKKSPAPKEFAAHP